MTWSGPTLLKFSENTEFWVPTSHRKRESIQLSWWWASLSLAWKVSVIRSYHVKHFQWETERTLVSECLLLGMQNSRVQISLERDRALTFLSHPIEFLMRKIKTIRRWTRKLPPPWSLNEQPALGSLMSRQVWEALRRSEHHTNPGMSFAVLHFLT